MNKDKKVAKPLEIDRETLLRRIRELESDRAGPEILGSPSFSRRRRVGAGWIYALSNPFIPGLLKIGFTSRTPEARAWELYEGRGGSGTGVPGPFSVELKERVGNTDAAESFVHQKLHEYRVNQYREYFQAPLAEVKKVFAEAVMQWPETEITSLPPPPSRPADPSEVQAAKQRIAARVRERAEKESSWRKRLREKLGDIPGLAPILVFSSLIISFFFGENDAVVFLGFWALAGLTCWFLAYD